MFGRSGLRSGVSHHRFTIMFLVVLLPPAVTLVWLGLRMLEQDRLLQDRREREGREAAAEEIVRSLAQSIAEVENASEDAAYPEGLLRVVVSSDGVRAHPADRLLWTENPPRLPEPPAEPFFDADIAEDRGSLESAIRASREFAQSNDSRIRAGALLRLARMEQKREQPLAAVEAYRTLASLDGVAYNGQPVNFVARRETCRLLRDSGVAEEHRACLDALQTDFLAGRWTLDSVEWGRTARDLRRWTGSPLAIIGDREALSAAAEWIWQTYRAGELPEPGHRSFQLESAAVITTFWRIERTPEKAAQLSAFIIAPAAVQAWIDKIIGGASDKADRLGHMTLQTESDELFLRASLESGVSMADAVRRSFAETGLPWTLTLYSTDRSRAAADVEGRRQLLAWGLAIIVLLLAGGGYVLWRAMAQQMALARLQSDFVATVSHEFRTPLTALQHITELLREGNDGRSIPGAERLNAFYAALERNTERLRRLVESLLDFSRMETGRKPWRLEPLDAGMLTANIASEFQEDIREQGVRIDCSVDDDALPLQADADALGHALWNLLDNAVKYSPPGAEVEVSAGKSPKGIVISVKDHGMGIPVRERGRIFDKFVRGDKARELGIKGTGLGLSIVSHIVEAHGGSIELESEEGRGSTFSLVFPLDEQDEHEEQV